MRKRTAISLFIIMLLTCTILLSACACEHDWTDAECTTPKTCELCGETEGEPLGHRWVAATCVAPATCSRCGAENGDSLGHEWVAATCSTPAICVRCSVEDGVVLEHQWKGATCTEADYCVACGIKTGEPLGHSVSNWLVVQEASCAIEGIQEGLCSGCGNTITIPIEKAVHTPGEWIIAVEATSVSDGKKVQSCTVCNEELATEAIILSDEEKATLFKQECKTYSYKEVARNPDSYVLEKVKFRGEVIQVVENGDNYVLRVCITKGRYTWTDAIYVEYTKKSSSEPRILEDDIITLYGYFSGTVTYETVLGASVTIPAVWALYIDIE